MDMMENFFNLAFMVQLSLVTPTLALNFYAFMAGQSGDKNHYFFLYCLLVELFQILFYCWFGSEVTVKVRFSSVTIKKKQIRSFIHYISLQSAQLNNVIYMSKWLEMSKKNRMALLMIMARATQPIIFTMGNVFDLSIDTFTKVK